MSWRKPKFFYNTGIAALTATPTPPTSNPAAYLIDGFDGTLWKAPDTTTQVIKHDKGARRKHPFDFLTLVGHNFATAQPDIKLEYSDDDVTYQTALAIPAKAAFTRASTAYHSDGVQATSGTPRYETDRTGKILGAIMIEEGTTNLLTANQASVETDTTGFTALLSATLTRDTTYFRHGAASLKVVTPGSVINEGVQIDGPAGTISLPYAGRIKILAPLGAAMEMLVRRDSTANYTLYAFVGTGAWQDVSNVVVTLDAAATSVKILVRTRSTAQAITFYIDMNQLEQKAYSTSWQLPGTARVADLASFPTAGVISPTGFSWSQWVYITDVAKRQVSGQYNMIFNISGVAGAANKVYLAHQHNSAIWFLVTTDDGSTTTQVNISDSYTQNGWNHIVVTCNSSDAKVYINGVLRATISSPALPSAFSTAYIGSNATTFYLNTSHDDVQTWNRALTDAEAAAVYARTAAMPHPASRAFFTFDESLVNGVLQNPAIVQEFTQISSRFQKLTLSNNAAIPQASIGYWGEGKEMDYVDKAFDPGGVEIKANVNISETGYMSGIHEKYTERSMTLAWDDADDALYQVLKKWFETVGLLNFLVGWELESHPEDIYLMHADPKFINPLAIGTYRDITLKLLGRKL